MHYLEQRVARLESALKALASHDASLDDINDFLSCEASEEQAKLRAPAVTVIVNPFFRDEK